MSVFAAAIDVLFADPNLAVDATYRAGGQGSGLAVRTMVRQPDLIGSLGETRILSNTAMFDLRFADLPAEPGRGDTLEWSGQIFVVQGEAMNDALRLVWTVEARPL